VIKVRSDARPEAVLAKLPSDRADAASRVLDNTSVVDALRTRLSSLIAQGLYTLYSSISSGREIDLRIRLDKDNAIDHVR
jgi:hypothetical protein